VAKVNSNGEGVLLFSDTVETFLNQRETGPRSILQRSETKSIREEMKYCGG
jgi:hypothetical protein